MIIFVFILGGLVGALITYWFTQRLRRPADKPENLQEKVSIPELPSPETDVQQLLAEEKARLQAQLQAGEEENRRTAQQLAEEKARLEAQRQATEEENRRTAQQLAEEKARLEAQPKAAEEENRRTAQQLAEEKARLEAQLQAGEEENRRTAQQLAEEKARLEAQRQAAEEENLRTVQELLTEEKTRMEAQRQAAEEENRRTAQQLAEEKARLEAQWQAVEEENRRTAQQLAEEKARLEAQWQAAEEENRRIAQQQAAEEKARLEAQRLAAEESAKAAAPKPVVAKTPAETLVMIVDDSKVGRIKTNRVLLSHQFQVQMAEDGRDAVNKIAARIPDLVITDVEMPEMDGFELTIHIRQNPATANIPVIVISGNHAEYATRAKEVGADMMLGKPYSDEDLVGHVNRLLQSRG
ncbi:MAG: response regulator [Rhodoferax sp.]|nr:response regulator [Rhodoferax sp.]